MNHPQSPNQPPYGQPNQQQPPYGAQPYGQPGYEQPSGTPGMVIAGFVCSFLCGLLGLIFSIIGYNQAKQRGGKGSGLAIAGIVISAVNMLTGIIIRISMS